MVNRTVLPEAVLGWPDVDDYGIVRIPRPWTYEDYEAWRDANPTPNGLGVWNEWGYMWALGLCTLCWGSGQALHFVPVFGSSRLQNKYVICDGCGGLGKVEYADPWPGNKNREHATEHNA